MVQKIIEKIVNTLTETTAKQVLNKMNQDVSRGSVAPVPVSTAVDVFEVREKTTGQTTFVSKVTLKLNPDKDLKNVNIVEAISKSVATSVSEITFLGEQPKVLQADPVVQWTFPVVEKNETKILSYSVAKKIEKIETTVAVAEVISPTQVSLSLLLVVLGSTAALVGIGFGINYIRKRGHYRYESGRKLEKIKSTIVKNKKYREGKK